jgi:hypothetical protein
MPLGDEYEWWNEDNRRKWPNIKEKKMKGEK